MRFVVEHDFPKAVIESDAMLVIQAITDKQVEVSWEYAAVIDEIRYLLASNVDKELEFKFIPRRANVVVDWLVKSESLVSNLEVICITHNELTNLLRLDATSICC